MTVVEAREKIGPLEFLRWQLYIIQCEEEEYKSSLERRGLIDEGIAALSFQVYQLIRKVDSIFEPTKMPMLELDKFRVKFNLDGAGSEKKPEMTFEERREWRSNMMRGVVRAMIAESSDPRFRSKE